MTIRISLLSSFLILILFLSKPSTQFSEDTIKFSISEDAPINTIIGTLPRTDGYTYRLSRGNSKIRFDDQSLEFSVSSPLDRESENAIDMLIITSPPSIIHVLVDILDVNDNAPKFGMDVQKVDIPETAPIGFRTQISGATDPDQAKNGTIGKYELVETTVDTKESFTPFQIVQSDGFVYLEVIGKLDREERELYAMRMTATDQGVPELSSSCLLNIIILDINDNPPDFGIRSTTVTWNGLQYPNSQLFKLNATDADSGENGHLTYRILPGPHQNSFGITEENILVTQNNTECLPRCDIVIEARDSGVPSLATTLDVVVMVEYGNEHEPNINIRFYPSDYPFIVVQPEDVNGKTLAILSITDPDGPLGPNSTIWIENGNENSIFSLISRQSINILTLKNVENAKKEEYNLEFMANDGQTPKEKIGRKILKIFFKKFIKPMEISVEKEYNVQVERDTVPGSFVAHIMTNCSEMCTFELMNSDVFRIDQNNGIIVTSSKLPDDVTSYHLPIRIHPPPPSTQVLETDVFVKIIQEPAVPKNLIRSRPNDVVHLKRAYSFATWQNVTVGTVVGKLPRGTVYSTMDTISELGVFPDGSIFVGKSISKDLVTLPVVLEQNNTTQTTLVTVIIKPLNLHSPTCQSFQDLHVPEDVPRGTVIGRLHASDADSGANGVIFYRILTSSEYFHVEKSTGILRILKTLDAEKMRNLTLQYEARDYGTPPKSTNCSLNVFIDDVNDNAPEFSSKFYSAKISGKSNETVAIIHADDEDVISENSRIQYRLVNHRAFFHVDKDSGKVTTIQNLPKTFRRLNVSLEAVNDDFLATTTFLLVTVEGSEDVEVHLNSEDVIRIFKNDDVGSRISKIDVTSSDTIFWRSEDPRFHVDSSGNIILIQKTSQRPSDELNVTLTSESGDVTKALKFYVEYMDSDRNEDVVKVEEMILEENSTKILDLSENWKSWKIGKIVLENSGNFDDVMGFLVKDRILYRPKNWIGNAIIVLESGEDSSDAFRILHVTSHLNPTTSSEVLQKCTSSVHLITPPATVPLPSGCDDVTLQNLPSKLQVHGDTLLIPTQSELISHVDLTSSEKTSGAKKPFMMTLIRDESSEDVKFSTSNILMLLSSVHQIGASFGRVTAESGYRIRYFLVGTDQISIDPDSGELFLRKRFFKNLNDIQIVAVIPKGIAKAKITIEVIEDRLVLTQNQFFIMATPPLTSSEPTSESPIGSIFIDRDDVIIDVIDDNFYIRNREIYLKPSFTPSESYYELEGNVKKGKLSAPINITVFFGRYLEQRNGLKEHELMFEVEENSPVGTVVGRVPNYLTSKYRLIDPTCGLLIDSEGIIKTTVIFDHEMTSLLKTKMIDPFENVIWDLLIFIEDVNDNPSKILNAPERIVVNSEDFHYKLHWHDSDDVASDVFFEVVDGDVFGILNISDSGDISLTSTPSESFNATIRIYDNRPPFKMNSDDATIEFHVEKKPEDVGCVDEDFYIPGRIQMTPTTSSEKVTWRILNPEKFWINPISGEIQKTSGAILKAGDVFSLKIQAISYDAEKTGFCTCRIHVLEDSESQNSDVVKKVFTNSTFEFWIAETADRFTEVGKVTLDSEFLDDVVFRILNDYNFTISPFDGTIRTNIPLDYEEVRIFEFDVFYSEARCHVAVHVIDENDETPRFITGDVVNLMVLEGAELPYPAVIGSSIAEDLDEGQNGVVTYSILSGNTSLFAVNSTTGEILSLSPLDREESPLYELLIEAKDAGIPSLFATSLIRIHVEDVNDNTPEFDLPSYFVRIPENLKPGSRVLKVHARDKDEGSRLLYFLESEGPFKIDTVTGEITVAGKIDREDVPGFRIHVVVTDGERNSTVVVEVEVEDVNDNFPRILNSNLDVFVPDDVTSTVIHVIDVQDSDINDHLKFYINDTTFRISEFGEILSTSESTYPSAIRVTVTDDVGHVANSEYRFFQYPKKNFPVFIEKLDTVSVREHDEQELAVFKAKGQGVRYSLASRCKDHLEIEGVTGILKAKSTLDRERFSECHVSIIATSFIQNKPLSAITKITIRIVDTNDNSPRFDYQLYQFNITENSGPTLIGQVIARDRDSESRIFYEIVSGDSNHEFMITENGQIESIRDLDRETRSEYHLILEAFDDGKPRRRGNTTVIIRILDEDDNAPRFSRIFHVEVPEDVGIGESVIVLSASDSDEKSEHRFEFENSGDEKIPFRIEEKTGEVFVNNTLDFEKKSNYRIKVRLTDGAWLIETSLFVNIKDINDNAPIFEEPEYFFIVDTKNSTIGRLLATDQDSGLNSKIRYSMTSPYFRIHPESGVMTKLRPLPEDVMRLEVVAMDHGIPRLQTTVIVHVAEILGRREIRKIRKTAKEGDVIARKMTSGAKFFPSGLATVTRNGDVILKRAILEKETLRILENSTMMEFQNVDSEFKILKIEDVNFNVTTSSEIQRLQIPKISGCVKFHASESWILENGTIFWNSEYPKTLKIHCHDDIWPIQMQNLTMNFLTSSDSKDSDDPRRRPTSSRRIQKTLPKNLEIRTSSESPSGTILLLDTPPIFMENNTIFNVTDGNLILQKTLTSSESQLEIFSGVNHKRTTIKIMSEKDSSTCPIFPKKFYFFEKSENSEIHNFGWTSEDLKACKMEVEDENPLFYANGSSLISLMPLQPGTYQLSLILRSTSDQSIISKCHVSVTVPPTITVPAHQTIPAVIYAAMNYSNPIFELPENYKLHSENLKFQISNSGAVRSRGTLNSGMIYGLEVEKKNQKTLTSSEGFEKIRILLDDVIDEEDVINYHIVDFKDSENLKIDLGTSSECIQNCDVITEAVNKTIQVLTSSKDSGDSRNCTTTLNVISESSGSQNLEFHAVTIDVICSKSSISRLILTLRSTYSDMTIHCLATWQISEDVKYQMTFAFVDRNGVVVEASEVQKTLTSFFKKHRPGFLEFLGFQKNVCEGVTCIQKGAECRSILKEEGSRIISRSTSSIFNLPQKTLIPKCFCEASGGCDVIKSEDVPLRIQKTCEDVDCGSGKCVMDPTPICRCIEGKSAFESSQSCEKASDVFSTSSEGHLKISMKNSSLLKCDDECEDVQKIEFDFRTIQMKNELLRVEFGKQTAIVEIISGSIHFSISDEFTRPVQTSIEKSINDGRWHRLLLQMSDGGRRISLRIDGRGKEVKSREPLPMLFTSERILLVTSPRICFRRLLIQNQFVDPMTSSHRFFEIHSTSTVTITCQFDPTSSKSSLFNISNTTTVILLAILAIISLIALSVCILAIRRRWKNQKTSGEGSSSGWKKATEIDAFAAPRRARGHVNRSMMNSPDDDTYDVTYGAQMKSTSTDDMTHIYTSSSSRRYQPQVTPYRRDGHINMAYL